MLIWMRSEGSWKVDLESLLDSAGELEGFSGVVVGARERENVLKNRGNGARSWNVWVKSSYLLCD